MTGRSLNRNDRFAGYSALSIALHWVTAIVIIVLYLYQNSKVAAFHMGLGIVVAPLLMYRVTARFSRGYPRISELGVPFNLAARLVMLALLACIFILVVTGLLLPALSGEAYSIFDWTSFALPVPANATAAAVAGSMHAIAGHACILLFVLHMLDALTHHFFDKDTILIRMLKPIRNGK